MDQLKLLERLMYYGRVEIKEGVFLVQHGEINVSIYNYNDQKIVIKFLSPQPTVSVERIGILKSFVRPVLNKIQITDQEVIVVLDRFKDMRIDRRELEERLRR